MRKIVLCALSASTVLLWPLQDAAAENAGYHVTREIPIAGDGGWDLLSLDPRRSRLYVTHGNRVQVLDTLSLSPVGEIPDTPGAHGVAIADDLGRGYVTAGQAGTIVAFDLDSLQVREAVQATGEGPDTILYDSFTKRVFSFNGRGRNVTAIDAARNAVIGTIALDAKPEFAVSDGAGRLYVNLEDTDSIAVIDARKLAVRNVWRIAGCEGPTGLAIDRAHRRLFAMCSNKTMVVVDSRSGSAVASLPIGARVDGAEFDPGLGLAFASAGDGTLTVVREETPDKFSVAQTVTTRRGARTMVLEAQSHRLYLVTAAFGPAPAPTAEQPHPHPAVLPDSFVLLVVEP